MRPTAQPFNATSWTITVLIGLVFVGLGYGLRLEIRGADSADPPSWLDLALLLCGYLFMFCLKPIQQVVQRRLCQHSLHKSAR